MIATSFVVTFTPYFQKSVLKELHKVDNSVTINTLFDAGRALATARMGSKEFIQKLTSSSPIFIKHIMPVLQWDKITGNANQDKSELLYTSEHIVNMSGNDKFAVQCRIIDGNNGLEYSSKDVEVFIGEYYSSKGNIPTFSDNTLTNDNINVISILINKNNYYMGYSTSKDNLNFHCDEYRICSKTGREISRAENKLKEALVKFGIKLTGDSTALDLGAAPGGWTKVLADCGCNVVAVDPGDLHPSLQNDPRIKHHKCRIEQLTFSGYFDIIVNDMNVEPQLTAEIMCGLVNLLKNNGLAIVTFKLPSNIERGIEEASEIISTKYDILTIKNLFHNRREVTVLLRKKQQK